MKQTTMPELVAAWRAAKAAEQAANAARLDVERQMLALIPPPEGNEGTVSMVVADCKVSVCYGVTRSVDTEALQAMWDTLPAKAQEAFAWKASVSTPKLRALQEYMPTEYSRLAAVVGTKPSKPAVSVDELAREVA